MFKCQVCGEPQPAKVSPVRVVVHARAKEYHNVFYREDEYGNRQKHEVHSQGHESVREINTCNVCAQVKESVPSTTTVIGARSFQEKPAPPMRVALVACAIDSMLARLSNNTKRAKQETETVVPGIKQFVDANKQFVF